MKYSLVVLAIVGSLVVVGCGSGSDMNAAQQNEMKAKLDQPLGPPGGGGHSTSPNRPKRPGQPAPGQTAGSTSSNTPAPSGSPPGSP